jgi:hypothetical protein
MYLHKSLRRGRWWARSLVVVVGFIPDLLPPFDFEPLLNSVAIIR